MNTGFDHVDLSIGNRNTAHTTKSFRYFKQQNQKTNSKPGFGRKPAVRRLSEQRALVYGFASRNRERSCAELQPSAKRLSVPRCLSSAVSLFPIAYPGKVGA